MHMTIIDENLVLLQKEYQNKELKVLLDMYIYTYIFYKTAYRWWENSTKYCL